MPKKISVIGAVAALALASQDVQAFAPATSSNLVRPSALFSEDPKAAGDAVFVPPEEPAVEEGESTAEETSDISLETVEMLGRGAAKVCHGTAECFIIDRDGQANLWRHSDRTI